MIIRFTLILVGILCAVQFAISQAPEADPFAEAVPIAQRSKINYDKEHVLSFHDFQSTFDATKAIKVEVLPVDLKTLMESRSRLFIIDTRERNAFDVSHIKGAKWVGFDDFTFERIWMLDRNATIIVYCLKGNNSLVISEYLKAIGFKDVRLIVDNFKGWINAGYSMVNKEGHTTPEVYVDDPKHGRKLKKVKLITEEE